MQAVNLLVSVPICSFRKPYAREFFESERIPPPATVYGFLLSFIGEEDRHVYIGSKIAVALMNSPSVSIVLRTLWRIKDKNNPPGIGNNKRPDYQELLTGLMVSFWVADGPLADKVRVAAAEPGKIGRFGGLSLGESRDLVDEVIFAPKFDISSVRWLINDPKGNYPLTIWVDHVGSKGTKWGQFRLVEMPPSEPPADDQRWITIEPPGSV